jgi:hypothetical protein
VTITRGDLTSPGPLQKGVYSLTRMSGFGGKTEILLDQSIIGHDPDSDIRQADSI